MALRINALILGEGNGNPLQCSCLENPVDRGARQATVHRITRARHDLATIPDHHSSVGKSFSCNVGDPGLIPGSGRSPGEGNGSPLQYSCLENPIGRGDRQAAVHRIARVRHDLATTPPPPHSSWGFPSSSDRILLRFRRPRFDP